MKIALIQPNLSENYQNQRQAYGSLNRPPETGLAVLSAYIKEYSKKNPEVEILDPNQNIDLINDQVINSDILGLSDWFSNHDTCMDLAKKVKLKSPDLKIVIGGPNVSMIPKEILANHPYIDYVVSRDGEDALLGLVENKSIKNIPNLWYRENGKIRFTNQSYTNLKNMPIWNFENFQNLDDRLDEYLSAQKSGLDPWLIPPLTLFSFRRNKFTYL